MNVLLSRMFLVSALIAALTFGSVSAFAEAASDSTPAEPKLEDQFNELTDEWQRRLVDAMRQILANELSRLKAKKTQPAESLQSQISDHETVLKKHPKNPSSHFALGSLYSDLGDGANAIIHMKKAERLFKDQDDIKGVAESRRNLRNYFSKFGYKPEDFDLQE